MLTDIAENRFQAVRDATDLYLQVAETADTTVAALAAQWTADLLVMQELLWQTRFVPAPDRTAAVRDAHRGLDEALARLATSPEDYPDAAALLQVAHEHARQTLTTPELQYAWQTKMQPVVDLTGVPVPTPADWMAVRDLHVGREPVAALLEARKAEHQRATMGLLTNRPMPGDPAGHQRVWDLDWSIFHTVLVDVAHRTGDEWMLSVDLRWRAAGLLVSRLDDVPETARDAAAQWRDLMMRAVGHAEAALLRNQFVPL